MWLWQQSQSNQLAGGCRTSTKVLRSAGSVQANQVDWADRFSQGDVLYSQRWQQISPRESWDHVTWTA
jgi:hypothetical protein